MEGGGEVQQRHSEWRLREGGGGGGDAQRESW